MAPRIPPGTTISVILAITLALQLVAILSVPITKGITLCTYDGYKFGVFGLCYGDTCSSVRIGYTSEDIGELEGFSLPSNARHSISKLLIIHVVSAGFTLVLFLNSILLHWHGPSNSLRLLFFLLLWTIPTFLLSLLSFLIDLLLFVPHLDWGSYIVLAATVLISVSGVLLCIMRRTVSSRKGLKSFGKANNAINMDYQLAPLNYGYGTVDSGSSFKKINGVDDIHENESEIGSELGENNETFDFQENRYEDINQIPKTTRYDLMDHDNNQSPYNNDFDILPNNANNANNTNNNNNNDDFNDTNNNINNTNDLNDIENKNNNETEILLPLNQVYRPEDYINPLIHYNDNFIDDIPTAPYPTDIPEMNVSLDDLPIQGRNVAPYPTEDLSSSTAPRFNFEGSPTKPLGPRPMPNSSTSLNKLGLETEPLIITTESDDDDEPTAPPLIDAQESLISTIDVKREPTFRTRIEQTLNQLQPEDNDISTDSLNESFQDSYQNRREESVYRDVNDSEGADQEEEIDKGSVDSGAYARNLNSNSVIDSNQEFDRDEGFAHINKQYGKQIQDDDDDNSDILSQYSSNAPSEIITPNETKFPESSIQRNYQEQVNNSRIPQKSNFHNSQVSHQYHEPPSDITIHNYDELDGYRLPHPEDKRNTPPPSFSNESFNSSNFTSVSQRGINPRYMNEHPEEFATFDRRTQKIINGKLLQVPPKLSTSKQVKTPDILDSNPDFKVFGRGER
ncbi:hypothetical protein WICMUC_000725 [Wickerhamomyces mucosus]|uniref:PH-response regulator protein palI/RIM9 n=1 Tax=Wickerhamomyces mucosus TaxID=1378264 RepID=A0A9P8PYA3_9ASCO|nr:hypothetical protein WICMUC_000725 [Wickerhamomyces mucosus]